LRQRGFAADDIDAAVSECRRLNYIDDGKFSDLYALHLRRKGYGSTRIAHVLKTKGVSGEHIDRAVKRHCDDHQQIEDCRRALAKKLRTTNRDQPQEALKRRLFRFLNGRGFSLDIIHQVIGEGLDGEWAD